MRNRKIDRIIIKGLNITVSMMGTLIMVQNGITEGFSKSRTISAFVIVSIVIWRSLEDLERAIRKGAGDENPRRKERRVGSKAPKNHISGTPWTEVQFNQYREINRDSSDNAATL